MTHYIYISFFLDWVSFGHDLLGDINLPPTLAVILEAAGAVSRTMTKAFSRPLSLATHGQFDVSVSDIGGTPPNWFCALKVFITPARAAVKGVGLSNSFWPPPK